MVGIAVVKTGLASAMPKDLSLRQLDTRATIPSHFAVPASTPSPKSSSSESDTFVPTPLQPPSPQKSCWNHWNKVETVCSRVLRERLADGSTGTVYHLGKPIGQGAFGEVFPAQAWRPDGRKDLVCMKRIAVKDVDPFAPDRDEHCTADTEATAMLVAETWLGPKNLLYEDDKTACKSCAPKVKRIEYAYIEEMLCHGNMAHAAYQFRKRHPECLELLVMSMVEQTAKRLGVMHRKGWVHRDVKPENLLFLARHKTEDGGSVSGEIFVGDYGRGRLVSSQNPRLAGLATPGFISPGAAVGPCRPGDDVWALGVTAIDLLMDESPFDPVPHVEHPKDANGRPVSPDNTELQMEQWQVTQELLAEYIQWYQDPAKDDDEYLSRFFAELAQRYPRAARLIAKMIDPHIEARISCRDLVAEMGQKGVGLSDAERRQLDRAWQDIKAHPRIATQHHKLGQRRAPLQRSRTFDAIDIPTGYEPSGLRRGRAKGIPADVDGLAEKLANVQVADVKASFERKYVQRPSMLRALANRAQRAR